MSQEYEAIIGIEVHIRLKTESGMYAGARNAEEGGANTNTCVIDVGHPGTLPALNQEAVRLGTLLSLALHAKPRLHTKFDRKHYFYPDLPKGYQISQFDEPLAEDGELEIYPDNVNPKVVRIERLHLEEDAAKLKHDSEGNSHVDFNRAGAPLVELVTRPDIRTAEEAKVFVQELQQIARYVGASHADMEKGHMRCDANVSLRPVGEDALYPKTEVKNMNSFRSIEKAIEYEIARQTDLWNKGEAPEITTTRGWDDKRGITVEQRSKEGAADYRYFPEPDIPPLERTEEEIAEIAKQLPELPQTRRERFKAEYFLSYEHAKTLTSDPAVGEFYEHTMSELRGWLNSLESVEGTSEDIWSKHGKKASKLAASWLLTEVFGLLKETGKDFSDVKFTAENFAELLALLFEKKVNSSAGQKILRVMFEEGGDPSLIMRDHDLEQVSDEGAVDEIVERIIADNAEPVADYKNGKEKALMYLVGQVMKETKGKVNPEVATQLLKDKIG